MRKIIVCVLLLLLVPAIARAQTVSYAVSIPKPTSSLLHVVMEIRGAQGASVDMAMPAWSPGAYNMHWAAKNVQRLSAQDGNGRALAAAMVDTSAWRITPAAPQSASATTSTWEPRPSTTRTRRSSARVP